MTIPGHAPRPSRPADPHHQRMAPFRRDEGLQRVAQITKWTLVGGLVATGGFAAVATAAQATASHPHAATLARPTATIPGVAPTVPAVPAPATVPSATQPAPGPAQTTPQTVPETVPQPVPQPTYAAPQYTPAPPVVASGGS